MVLPKPTMFKLEPFAPGTKAEEVPRKVACVNCHKTLTMAAYAMGATRLDEECPYCRVKAEDYWKGRPHEIEWIVDDDVIDDDRTENNNAG